MNDYRVLWQESIAGVMYWFSGRVHRGDIASAEHEANFKRNAHNFHTVMVEARSHSEDAWPRWFDQAMECKCLACK